MVLVMVHRLSSNRKYSWLGENTVTNTIKEMKMHFFLPLNNIIEYLKLLFSRHEATLYTEKMHFFFAF